MAFVLSQVQTYFSQKWRADNIRRNSQLASLFPNELKQEGAFNSVVRLPILTEAIIQENWDPRTGFDEKYTTDKHIEVKLDQNWTVYNRIDKVDMEADEWASNKMRMVDRQKGRRIDDYVLDVISTNTEIINITPVTITKDNLVEIFKDLEIKADNQKFDLQTAYIFVSPKLMSVILNSKLSTGSYSIDETGAVVYDVLGYRIIQARLDKYQTQLIALPMQAVSWCWAEHLPLQAGEYTQGAFLGEQYICENAFFKGKVVMPEMVLKMKEVGSGAETQSAFNENSSLGSFKEMSTRDFISKYQSNQSFQSLKEDFLKDIDEAKSIEDVEKVIKEYTELMT